ncbi:MAG: YbjN domain-containing protein [Gemmatimonadetes bacterium]|nr:YbjN domain-containing protein [Gemmatimonadota bacterium]
MLNREDIESFLIRSEADFQEVEEGLWLVLHSGEDARQGLGIVVNHQPPVVVFRADVRDLPIDDEDQLELYRRLLELNAVDLIHGAYGLEDGKVILSDTLELENLDFSEFRASLESLSLALTSHWGALTADISNE